MAPLAAAPVHHAPACGLLPSKTAKPMFARRSVLLSPSLRRDGGDRRRAGPARSAHAHVDSTMHRSTGVPRPGPRASSATTRRQIKDRPAVQKPIVADPDDPAAGSVQDTRSQRGLPDVFRRLLDPRSSDTWLDYQPDPNVLAAVRDVPPQRVMAVVRRLGNDAALRARVYPLHRWLRLAGYAIDSQLCSATIKALIRGKPDRDAASEVLQWAIENVAIDAVLVTQGVNLHLAMGEPRRAEALWSSAIEQGVTPDGYMLEAFAKLCVARSDAQALHVLLQSLEEPTAPRCTPYLLTALTKACKTLRVPGYGPRLHAIGKRSQLRMTPHVAAALIAGMPTLPQANAVFQEMLQQGYTPDSVSCTALLQVIVRSGEMQRAAQFLEWMSRNGVPMTVVTYSVFLSGLAEHAEDDAVATLPLEAYSAGRRRAATTGATTGPVNWAELPVDLNHHTYAGMIRAAQTLPRARAVYRLWKEMELNDQLSGGEAQVVVGAMMTRFLASDMHRECLETFSRARTLGIRPGQQCFNIALCAASRAGDHAAVEALFDASPARDRVTYETMVGHAARRGAPRAAEEYLQLLLAAGLRPGDSAWVGLIEAYCRARQPRIGVRCLGRVSKFGGGTRAYNAILTACEVSGEYERAIHVFEEMRRVGVKGDAATRLILASCGKKGLAQVVDQQNFVSALTTAAAVAGGMLIRAGIF
ncbi:unnamed protein product [Pedinophyceae sp. YPF-701]|nr:unnamed protein product [Pedinophyceae sp. YPF-701]